jgi:phosphoglycerate dehydrogenase-like enzyme
MVRPMRPLILLDPYPRPVDSIFDAATRARLESLGEVLWHNGAAPAHASYIDRHLPHTTILIGQSALPKERLERAPRLQAIFNVESNFLPNVDYAECHRRGIHVAATGPVFGPPVAEMALGLALAAARRIPQADAAIRAGNETLYGTGDNHDSILLSGRTMALVGCGNLGRSLLPLLRPFGGELLVYDPWIHPSVLRAMGVTPVSLEEAFLRATVVFILAATTTENQGAIDHRHFRAMRPGGIVVLISRASVVNFEDLLDAAASGHIRAAIDVWPEEPIPPDHRARRTANTVLQAHRAGNIPEIWPIMGEMVTDDVELVLRGLPPQRCQRAVLETVTKLRSKPVG